MDSFDSHVLLWLDASDILSHQLQLFFQSHLKLSKLSQHSSLTLFASNLSHAPHPNQPSGLRTLSR